MELYDAIFYRKSTRKYSNKKVKEGLLEEVKNACSQITYLNKELDIKAHVVDRGHLVHFLMGKKCKVKAPHYIIVTSNKGNDYLTLKFASKSDIWFHTKDFHGSHTILKIDNNLPYPGNDVLIKVAKIAAKHSKACNSSNVPVDYCEVKFVKKPSGAKPGMVIYTNNKTLNVTP